MIDRNKISLSKWWKCDLQIATPAWNFTQPEGSNYDFDQKDERLKFARLYMEKLKDNGIEVVALADHNTGDWIDVMKKAGNEYDVIVFPGSEVSTGTGSDGIHIIIIGKRNKSSKDFNNLLYSICGFSEDNPPYLDGDPVPSSQTLENILNGLNEDYLVLAPHALNENGIASGGTVKGSIRYKALHHSKLMAIDPGDCSNPEGKGFNDRFRRRELDNFPRLDELAFVHTSDAYSFDDLGSKFTWIRMSEPTLEGLRQSFLDHEARIICSWDPKLDHFDDRNPNNIKNGWIKDIHIDGDIGNSNSSINIHFHPGLNIIAGGRGSGKSTVVAGVRNLYSNFKYLPESIKKEAENFSENVFKNATISSKHLVQNSQEEKHVIWNAETGSITKTDDREEVETSFDVRVVNQKELFERVTQDEKDPFSASRSLIAYVDESLQDYKEDYDLSGSWIRRVNQIEEKWLSKVHELTDVKNDVNKITDVEEKIDELKKQIDAFDSPIARKRRRNNEKKINQFQDIEEVESDLRQWLHDFESTVNDGIKIKKSTYEVNSYLKAQDGYLYYLKRINVLALNIKSKFRDLLIKSNTSIDEFSNTLKDSDWYVSVKEAIKDQEEYEKELQEKGIEISDYKEIKQALANNEDVLKKLKESESKLSSIKDEERSLWSELINLYKERFDERNNLFNSISQKSGFLRFKLNQFTDYVSWINDFRNKLNFRSDAFLDDVPALAKWIWISDWEKRLTIWKKAIISGDLEEVSNRVDLRNNFIEKIESLEERERLSLLAIFPEDAVKMEFLKDDEMDKSIDDNWQNITTGSPGQRTAAMLGFVLSQGKEPLVLDQPEDDLDTELITELVVKQLRISRLKRQIIVVTHNANIPVLGDAENIAVLEKRDNSIRIRKSNGTFHQGAIEQETVRKDIQNIMEGGIVAFVEREKRYNNELNKW